MIITLPWLKEHLKTKAKEKNKKQIKQNNEAKKDANENKKEDNENENNENEAEEEEQENAGPIEKVPEWLQHFWQHGSCIF